MLSEFKTNAKILVQGATGREGQRAIEFMKNYGTNVVAGVTPGKGGQEVLGVPIFNSIKEALGKVGPVDAVSTYVPPPACLSAIKEVIESEIPFIHLITDGVPYQDLASMVKLCRDNNVQFLGPGSLGVLTIGQGRVGFLGGTDPKKDYQAGEVSIISRSGGMTNEVAHYLNQYGIGLRTMIHLGSDKISGANVGEAINALSQDKQTKIIVVFEEIVNNDLSDLAEFFSKQKLNKPVIISLTGISRNIMPEGVSFGHVDALLKGDSNLLNKNIGRIKSAGVVTVDSYEDFVPAIKNLSTY